MFLTINRLPINRFPIFTYY